MDERQPDERLPGPLPPIPSSSEKPPPSSASGRTRSTRSARERSDRGGPLAPPAAAVSLAEEERRLLAKPLRIRRADLYPASAEPHFLMEPPAPVIGEVDASYVEMPIEKSFRRIRQTDGGAGGGGAGGLRTSASNASLGAEGGSDEDRDAAFRSAPSGATQAIALLVGLAIHLAQGALAGASLMQLACSPWPDASNSLARPLAYAPLALPMQRTLHLLAGASFLAAVDLHAAAPRVTSGVLLVLYGLIVVTCVLQLPTDVALDVGRTRRLSALSNALDAHLAANASTPAGQPLPDYRPDLLPETALEDGGGFFSPRLSSSQFGLFQALICVRALLATLAWLLACQLQSAPAFGLPPLPDDEFTDGLSSW